MDSRKQIDCFKKCYNNYLKDHLMGFLDTMRLKRYCKNKCHNRPKFKH